MNCIDKRLIPVKLKVKVLKTKKMRNSKKKCILFKSRNRFFFVLLKGFVQFEELQKFEITALILYINSLKFIINFYDLAQNIIGIFAAFTILVLNKSNYHETNHFSIFTDF